MQLPKIPALSRVGRLGVAAAGVVALSVALPTAPAHAATSYAFHGLDEANVEDPDTWVHVGDFECDGNGVWIDYQVNGHPQLYEMWDSNGCNNGFVTARARRSPGSAVGYVHRFRVCENRVGCSGWVNT